MAQKIPYFIDEIEQLEDAPAGIEMVIHTPPFEGDPWIKPLVLDWILENCSFIPQLLLVSEDVIYLVKEGK